MAPRQPLLPRSQLVLEAIEITDPRGQPSTRACELGELQTPSQSDGTDALVGDLRLLPDPRAETPHHVVAARPHLHDILPQRGLAGQRGTDCGDGQRHATPSDYSNALERTL